MSNRILIFSSSRSGSGTYLGEVVPEVKKFVGTAPLRIAFIAFASVSSNHEEYLKMVQDAFHDTAYIIELVTPRNAKSLIESADVIMTGGGNTFKLLHDLYQYNLLDMMRDKVDAGAVYIGWSAGSNITCPTIGTSNDMPIIAPKSFNALGFFPFQVNPHYYNTRIEGFNGETRDQRLIEFTVMNPGIPIVCLPEGAALRLHNGELTLIGNNEAVLFFFDDAVEASRKTISPNSDLSFLL